MAQNQNIGLLGQVLTVNTAANTSTITNALVVGNSSVNVVINSSSVYVNGSPLSGGGGANLAAQTAFTNTAVSTNATSGAVQISGGLGVVGNVYTKGVVGFSNATNISVVYMYYNSTAGAIDTVFG